MIESNYKWFMPYSVWLNTTPVIPKMYWGIYSQEERIMHLCKEIAHIVAYLDSVGAEVDEIEQRVNDLIKDFAAEFDDYYKAQIEQWLNDNLEELVGNLVKFVFFGLTDDGYFYAYIPESWQFLQFSTGYDYNDAGTYGHLILEY